MEVGIGLPSTIPGVDRESLLRWARRAEELGFSSLGTIDRLVYPNYEPLTALAAAAAVTERIKLLTSILLAPLHSNHALLAKQAATLDSVAGGGRLVLGFAVGGREDDFEASGVPFHERGDELDGLIAELRRIWSGETGIGPPDGGITLIGGGRSARALRRAAEHAEGWISGGGGAEAFAEIAEKFRAAWAAAGRDGSPRLMAIAYYSLGDHARENAEAYIKHYYGWLGEVADYIVAGVATDAAAVREARDAHAAAGCDELVFFPCTTDVEQADLLADAVGVGP